MYDDNYYADDITKEDICLMSSKAFCNCICTVLIEAKHRAYTILRIYCVGLYCRTSYDCIGFNSHANGSLLKVVIGTVALHVYNLHGDVV